MRGHEGQTLRPDSPECQGSNAQSACCSASYNWPPSQEPHELSPLYLLQHKMVQYPLARPPHSLCRTRSTKAPMSAVSSTTSDGKRMGSSRQPLGSVAKVCSDGGDGPGDSVKRPGSSLLIIAWSRWL